MANESSTAIKRAAINAPGAVAVGPYSAAVEADGLVFLSGQTPLDPATGKLVQGGIREQTAQCFVNLFAVLRATSLTPDHVVKVNVFLIDMNDFAAMNEVYRAHFAEPFPARTTIGVAALPLGAKVEIEMIARRG
jgi:2-iminobutanoate/2-iminopropanoate deaminase